MLSQKAAYEAALAEERRIRQENEQKQAAEMAQMYNYIQSLSVQMGNPIPAFPVALLRALHRVPVKRHTANLNTLPCAKVLGTRRRALLLGPA